MAYAQDAAPQEAQEAGIGDNVIVVTGSRIARQELEATTPIQVVSAASIQEQGSPNISDILNELPAVGIGTSRTNTNFSTSGNGQATVNLRNLGENRTLVLMNGRRVVAGIGGSSAVDLNNIPTDLIEQVEIITGGASAVYGSEAMAGVVNFTLKKNYEGISARAQAGITKYGDLPTQLVSAAVGKNFADGRGNITLYGQYDNDGGLRSKNRKISANDTPFRSSFVPQGRFATSNNIWTYDQANNLKIGLINGVDGFNRNAERYISVPVERYMITSLGHYDFSDAIGVFFEGSYAKTKSRSRLEALATDNSDATTPSGAPYAGLTLDNPFIPTAILNDLIAAGDTELTFRKRMVGVFDRSNRNDRDYYRIVAGFQGEVLGGWKWDAYYNYGQTKESTGSETALRDRYFYALDAIAGPNGTVICRDPAARAAGCVPFNPFGFNSVSAASAAYITNNGQLSTYDAKVTQSIFAANISGSLFKLPGGDVQLAAGVEHRTEKSSEVYDLETQLGNTMGNALSNTIGKYHVFEAYAETDVPLISGKPLAEYLGLSGAVRFGDYSTVGSVWSWKFGGEYAPTPDIRFRAVYSQATRAPNIGEKFGGANQTFPTGLTDPCEGVTATSTGTNDAYCRTIAGVAAEIAANGSFIYDPNSDSQSIEGIDYSAVNPYTPNNLKEETAKTLTLGMVFTPQKFRNFSMTVDFFDIRIKNAILQFPRQAIINGCVASAGTSPLCALIVREGAGANPRGRTQGTIWQVDSYRVNGASIKTRGIDIAMRYKTPGFQLLGADSKVNFNLAYTYLDKLTFQPFSTLPVENNRGQLDGDGRLGAGFKHRANFSTGLDAGPFSFNWRINYQSKIKDTLGPDAASPLGDSTNSVGAYWYHDIQMGWTIGSEESRSIELYAGVDNLFDKKPPLINQNGASYITGTETAADTFDPYGRRYYMGAKIKF